MDYFAHLPDLEVKSYTDYFLNEFIPSRNFEENMKIKGRYVQYERNEFINEPIMHGLDNILRTQYKFPPIQYFIIFQHTSPQGIHIDGTHTIRWCSLNLPLSGYESTSMFFYKPNDGVAPTIYDANYYNTSDVFPVTSFEGKNEWVLVNSGAPHCVTNIDANNPRYTLCVRFYGNPKLEQLVNRLMVRGTGIEPVLTA